MSRRVKEEATGAAPGRYYYRGRYWSGLHWSKLHSLAGAAEASPSPEEGFGSAGEPEVAPHGDRRRAPEPATLDVALIPSPL
ncbi:MAG: hypothetical protein FJ020_04605 [Chloroflexi bacterium]|nr:hypothetical protein [Chloroflexota bacterium]